MLTGSLDIQKETRGGKRSFTGADYHFRRIEPSTSYAANHCPDTSGDTHNVPTVRSTITQHEAKNTVPRVTRNGAIGPEPEHPGEATLFRDLSNQNQGEARTIDRRREPRRFHLTRIAPDLSDFKNATPRGIQKRKRGLREDFPVFSEKKLLSLYSVAQLNQTKDQHAKYSGTSSTEVGQVKPTSPRKRPVATPIEMKWRNETWNRTSQSETTKTAKQSETSGIDLGALQGNVESLQLAAQLQELAKEQAPSADITQPGFEIQRQKAGLKVQPKRPPPRRHERIDEAMDTEITNAVQTQPYPFTQVTHLGLNSPTDDLVANPAGDQDTDEDWVTDTYFRHPNSEVEPADGATTSLGSKDQTAIGLLVITDEDEEIWESYAQQEDSDSDVDTDEDDENGMPSFHHVGVTSYILVAEDWHGNDYPDEEVESDDEYGRYAYHYRHAASDEEQFDGDAVSWSDEDDEGEKSWRTEFKV